MLKELADYARYHFSSEELWMLRGMYPEMVQHEAVRHFPWQTAKLQSAYATGQAPTPEMLLFLEEWIVNHILQTDARFGRYLLERQNGADREESVPRLHG